MRKAANRLAEKKKLEDWSAVKPVLYVTPGGRLNYGSLEEKPKNGRVIN
jgi:hypothetical protein